MARASANVEARGADQYPRVSEAACPRVYIGTASRTVTVCGPISIRKRGVSKLVLAPEGNAVAQTSVCRHIDNAQVKAIARAFRWRDMLDSASGWS
jgi:hypothetical protein